MPEKNEENKERSKISMRIGEVEVEFEGTSENIKKLMDEELFDFAKRLEGTAKQLSLSTEVAPKAVPKPAEVASKTKTVQPPNTTSTKAETPTQKSRLVLGTKTQKLGKKRTDWRNLATALIMVCIVLLASVIGTIAFYLPTVSDLDSQIAEKNFNIAELNANITSLNTQVSDLQDNLDQKDSEISDLEESLEYLSALTEHYFSILLMNESSYLLAQRDVAMNASESTMIYQYGLDYAGYVSVNVESTSNTTYVQLLYSYKGVNYNQNATVAENGIAYFPVLPAVTEIWIGNAETYNGDIVNATVTAVYYY